MKKMLVCVALLAAATTVNAQKFKIGLGGAFNSTWLMNKNVFDADDQLNIAPTFGGSFGLKAQYYFNDKVGLELGVMSSGNSQKYELFDGDVTTKVRMRYLDVPLMLRLGGDKGAYFEIGPNFGFLSKAEEEYDDNDAVDVKGGFNKANIGLNLGFGVDIDASESFTINVGLRFGYGFSDVTKKYDNYAEWLANLDENSTATNAAQFKNGDVGSTDPSDFKYKATSRVWGGLSLGVLYTIPTGGKTASK